MAERFGGPYSPASPQGAPYPAGTPGPATSDVPGPETPGSETPLHEAPSPPAQDTPASAPGGGAGPEARDRLAAARASSGARPFKGRRPARATARINLLFAAAAMMAGLAFRNGPAGLALDLLGAAAIALAAWLTREGLRAQDAYDARAVARRPALPRKLLGAGMTGIGLALAGLVPAEAGSLAGFVDPVLFALLGAGLHAFAFGADPLRDKGMEGIDRFQTDRVARAVDEAEKHLAAMSDAIRRAGDRSLETRVARFQATARDLFRTVENDPRDLTAARRYLSVYLVGARDATARFADLWAQGRDPAARADYLALLDDLETEFAARTRALLTDNRADLDIEIAVLRDRLGREARRPAGANDNRGE